MVELRCPFLFAVQMFLLCVFTSESKAGDSKEAKISTKEKTFGKIQFEPSFIRELLIDTNATTRLTVMLNSTNSLFSPAKVWKIILSSENFDLIQLNEIDFLIRPGDFAVSDTIYSYTRSITVDGLLIGKAGVTVDLYVSKEDEIAGGNFTFKKIEKDAMDAEYGLKVHVLQDSKRFINVAFITSLIIVICIANIVMGVELDLDVVKATLRKPIAPLIGCSTQFIAMPLLSFAIANVVFIPYNLRPFALGLFITGCAPGGGVSNYWTVLLGGNLEVSITMTFISSILAFFTMPAWIYGLGPRFMVDDFYPHMIFVIPYHKIMSSLCMLIVPLIVGVMIGRYRPHLRTSARKIIRPLLLSILVFFIVFGTAANLYMMRIITGRAVFGGLLLPWFGFCFGCLFAFFFRQKPKDVTAIAIETGIQNTGIAIILLKLSFPDPDADIAILIPVIVACFTPIPLFSVVVIHWIVKKFKLMRSGKSELEKAEGGAPMKKTEEGTLAAKGNKEIYKINPLVSSAAATNSEVVS